MYLHLAGIDSGYGFFAPNVSDCCKLGFELHYADGRIEYDLPSVSSHSAGLRLATFLDKLGRPEYDAIREEIIKLLAISEWREHTDATRIRAVFGVVVLPSVIEFERGLGEQNKFLYAYDFGFNACKPPPHR